MTGILHVHQGRFGRIALFDTNQPVVTHSHPQLHVLIKISGEDGAYEVAEHGSCAITDEQMVLINPWTTHANLRSAGGHSATILAFYVETSWMDLGSGLLPMSVFPNPTGPVTPAIRSLATRITRCLEDGESRADETESLLLDLMRVILDTYSGVRLPQPSRTPDHRIRRAVQLLREGRNFTTDPGEIAVQVGLSRSHFFERFKACVGMTPGTYVDGLRLDAAIGRLLGDDAKLSDISAELGFAEASHFSRFIKSKVGFSPREYRKFAGQMLARR